MIKPILAATAFAALVTPPIVQAQTADSRAANDRIVTAVNMDDIRAIIGSYGHTIAQEMPEQNGIIVEAGNGFKYLVLLKICGETAECEGVLIGSIHTLPAGATWEILNTADMQMDAFGIYVEGNSLIVDRYMILSGGVRVENFRHEIETLIVAAPPLVVVVGVVGGRQTASAVGDGRRRSASAVVGGGGVGERSSNARSG